MGFLNTMSLGLINDEPTTVKQEAMVTPEQQAAINALKSYYETGKIGGSTMKAGEAYGGSLGNYQTTGIEDKGMSALTQLLGNAQTMASKTFDPTDPSGVFQSFKKQALRDQGEQSDILNRNMAATGGLYSTNQGVQQRKLGENTAINLQTKLAELADAAMGRQLQANSGLQDAIGATQQYGGLARTLQNQEANAKYSAWLNQRTEQQNQIQNMLNAMNSNSKGVEWGTKSVTLPSTGLADIANLAKSFV